MKKIFLILCFGFLLPVLASATIGVGIGTGKIVVDHSLKAGLIYALPDLVVLNTGDEPSEYVVSITYHEGQTEIKPPKGWFNFEPSEFQLEPGQAQRVLVKLNLPINGVEPGNYFAYLEAHPIARFTAGGTSIGVAAATKLYFTVVPADIFQGIYYRLVSLYSIYYPWDMIILAVIFIIILLRFIGKRFKFQIARKE